MLDTAEFILKIAFLILSIIWAGKIIILRTDKQIVINPVLILLASVLAVLPNSNSIEIFGIAMQNIRIFLYSVYSLIVLFGLYSVNKKNGFF